MDVPPPIPPRPEDSHKGTFGTVLVVGGQVGAPRLMVGAPAFAAAAALRSGTGLAVLAVPEPILFTALEITPEATGIGLPVQDDGTIDPSAAVAVLDAHAVGTCCLVLGPGMGRGEAQQQVVLRLLSRDTCPVVLDADALNALAELPTFTGDIQAPAILTPHPGEFARLAAGLGLDADLDGHSARSTAAMDMAGRLGCVLVLKGPGTIVTDGQRTYCNRTGNAALATAGSGDVLAGVIGAFVSQFSPREPGDTGDFDLFECAAAAVHVHGVAADLWADENGEAGMLARDLLDFMPRALAETRQDRE